MMVWRKGNTNLIKMIKKMIGLKKFPNFPTDHSKKDPKSFDLPSRPMSECLVYNHSGDI